MNMKEMVSWAALAAAALLSLPATAAEDDLSVVKKALSSPQSPSAQPPALEEPAPVPAPRKSGKPEPQWLRVRTFSKDDKGEKHKHVSVNVPLSLVRALDDFPIDLCHHRWRDAPKESNGPRCEVKLADVLAALEAGQQLVEVEGENETVKIWVE